MAGRTKDPNDKHVKCYFTIHPDLLSMVDARAEELNETRSTFIATALQDRLGLSPHMLTQADLEAIGEVVLQSLGKK